jgi:hypothetical protein
VPRHTLTLAEAARLFRIDLYDDQGLSDLIDLLWAFDAAVLEIQCWKQAAKRHWN